MPLTNDSQFACGYTVSLVLPFYLCFLIESYAVLGDVIALVCGDCFPTSDFTRTSMFSLKSFRPLT